MKILISIVLVLAFQNNEKPEQIALNYFVKEILPSLDGKLGAIKFKGCTTGERTRFDERGICFDNDYSLWEAIQEGSKYKAEKEEITSDKKFFSNKGRNELKVYNATPVSGKFYVEIELRKHKSEIENYFIEISSGQVVRMCKMKFTIN